MKKVLDRFNMSKAKLVKVPIAPHFKLSSTQSPKTNEEQKHMSKKPYANAIDSMMYSMVCTRLDISYAVSLTSRFIERLGKEH